MKPRPSQDDFADEAWEAADRLHSAAIHLLRMLRREDVASGLSAPRLSALSVIVFGGPLTMKRLAQAEQVRPPTISRLCRRLASEGLVEFRPDPADGRGRLVQSTAKGRRLLHEGRRRRVARLAAALASLEAEDFAVLSRAAPVLERLTLPEKHPRQDKSWRTLRASSQAAGES